MRWIALVALVAATAALGIGCGDDDADGGDRGAGQSGEAMKDESGEAMKDESGEAMKDESGEAMKGESGEAMKGESGAATKDESGEAMKGESGAATKDDGKMKDDEAMKEDVAMKSDASSSAARGRLVKAVGSEYGRVVADAKGEAFYIFGKEQSSRSKCYGACARAWPPVLTKGKPRAGKGAKASLLGTTRRADGKRQVTYAGQPLYYYVDDTPGNILCQNVSEFGGLWLVVSPGGAPVT